MKRQGKKIISTETKVLQKVTTTTKAALLIVVASCVMVLGFLAKVIAYEFYILTQEDYQEILSSNVIGYVRDADTNEPIAGVEVSFDDFFTTSDETGYYKIALPKTGQYELKIDGEPQGYYSQEDAQFSVLSLPHVHHIYLSK